MKPENDTNVKKAPLQYFFPKAAAEPMEFRYRFSGGYTKSSTNAEGPGDKRGLIIAPFEGCFVINSPEYRWQWYSLNGKKQAYAIGVHRDATPEDFRRPTQLPGALVQLSHGYWMIPVANPMVDSCSLPFFEVPDGDGGWVKEVKDEYVRFSETALDLCGQLREILIQLASIGKGKSLSEIKIPMDEEEFRTAVSMMIAVNYDLTVEEMGALRLFDADKYAEMVFAFLDFPEIVSTIRFEMEAANAPLNPTEAPDGIKDTASGEKE